MARKGTAATLILILVAATTEVAGAPRGEDSGANSRQVSVIES